MVKRYKDKAGVMTLDTMEETLWMLQSLRKNTIEQRVILSSVKS